MEFDILSIIYISVIFIFMIVGLIKGLVKTLLGFFKVIISIILSALISKPLAGFLSTTGMGIKWKSSIESSLASKGEVFSNVYNSEYFDEAFSKLHLPEMIKGLLKNIVESFVPEMNESVGSIIARSIVYYAFIVISFVVLYLLIRLVFIIIIHIFSKIEKKAKPLKVINRVLGMAIYLMLSLLVIGGVNYIFTLIIGSSWSFAPWLIETMHLEDDVFTLSKFMYKHNTLLWMIQLIQNWMFK